MSNLSILDFYKAYGDIDGGISYKELARMTEEGLLQIRDKQVNFTLDEVASILNKSKRAISYWVQTGRIKPFKPDDSNTAVISAEELDRLIQETSVAKQKQGIYIKADTIEEVNSFVDKVVQQYNLNKYRIRIFVDINGTEGFDEMYRYLLSLTGLTLYTNGVITDRCFNIAAKEKGAKVIIV